MGYLFALVLLLFMGLPIVISADCSNDNLKTVEKCYKKMFNDFGFAGNIPDGDEFFNLYELEIKTMDGINKTCEASATLKDCLNADDVIANCLNLDAFNKLDFVKATPFWAQIYVTNFIEVDYSCGKGYEVLLESFQCINKFRGEWNTTNENNNNDDGCKAYENDATPKINAANKNCHAAAGCFVAKSSKINTCYYEEANCTFCGTLNINNLGYFDTLCTDDIPPPSPTTLKTTEPTTQKNGSSPVATISMFILLILSFVKFMVQGKFHGL